MPDQMEQPKKRTTGDKSFPWRCPKCLQKAVHPVVIPYLAKAAHDGRLYELDIPDLQIPQCASCGELVFSNRVDERITQTLRSQLRLLTPEQIRDARCRLGLQQKELAERLGTTEETLGRWESGTLIQPRAMDNLLRVYFAVPQVRAMLTGANQDALLGVEM